MTQCGEKRQHHPKPCLLFQKFSIQDLITKAASGALALRQFIQAVVLQQSKDKPDPFSGSLSECVFVLVLVDLLELEVVVERRNSESHLLTELAASSR